MNLDHYNRVVGSTAEEFAELGLTIDQLFPWQIMKMNQMYDLPLNRNPTLDGLGEEPVERMQGFLKTLQKEIDEGKEIMAALVYRKWLQKEVPITSELVSGLLSKLEITDEKISRKVTAFLSQYQVIGQIEELSRQILVQIADWLGDMNVYNRSEALKFGIPLESVLACIMGSNFTKLNADGSVTKNEHGKVEKGPNFLPPEDHIYATLFESEALSQEAYERSMQVRAEQAIVVPVLLNPLVAIIDRIEDVAAAQAADYEADDELQEDEESEEAPEISASNEDGNEQQPKALGETLFGG